jgi:hypothetical protein
MTRLLASGENGDIGAALRDRGWSIIESPVADLAVSYGRDLSDPFGANPGSSMEPPWLETSFLQGTREA